MGAVIGRAGRGKTTAAQRIYAQTDRVCYILFQELWTPVDMIREIGFSLAGLRPTRRDLAMSLIESELVRERRLIIVDEADRASISALNALRNIHDMYHAPLLLVGEEDLHRKLDRERRLISRMREVIRYDPLGQKDLIIFYAQAIGVRIEAGMAQKFMAHSGGDFRTILTDALKVERLMRANSMDQITQAVVDAVCKNGKDTK